MKNSWKQGEQFVWATGAAVSLTMLFVVLLLVVVMANGLGYFWPSELARLHLKDTGKGETLVLGELTGREPGKGDLALYEGDNLQLKVGNRDLYGQDFRWVPGEAIQRMDRPRDAVMLEREEFGNFHGFLRDIRLNEAASAAMPQAESSVAQEAKPDQLWETLLAAIEVVEAQRETLLERQDDLTELNREIEDIRREVVKLKYKGDSADLDEIAELEASAAGLVTRFEAQSQGITDAMNRLAENKAIFADVNGKPKDIALVHIMRAMRPNQMGVFAKSAVYAGKVWELLSGEPRESNTEGGLFPAIFGTVMMVLLMSLFSLPLGVVAAIYLKEYAKEGLLVSGVRIAVYNLAGVPSIVFGVFGLGFFVYGVGGGIDQLFFAESLPTPTFGTGGILWASLTLALLTVPVVVVATEEGLSSIPRGLREASLALGATKFQTLVRVVLPMAVPGILTGFILAMARAVGEVAPLMITGVVKLAPSLPIDGTFPFLHLERKFMHLGFHIYDVGFQSPNVEAAKPMVYITTLLLILIVLALSMVAIYLRNNLRKRFQTGTF